MVILVNPSQHSKCFDSPPEALLLALIIQEIQELIDGDFNLTAGDPLEESI